MYFSAELDVFDEGFADFSSCKGMTTYTHHYAISRTKITLGYNIVQDQTT